MWILCNACVMNGLAAPLCRMNHSCSPNLTTIEFPVTVGPETRETSLFPRIPRIGFFAARDIEEGQQLTLDYSPGRTGEQLKKVLKCCCGLKNCKGWLF